MGCDIHVVLEKEIDSEWVLVCTPYYDSHAMVRSYGRFAALAGVRGDGPKAKGLPADVSKGAKYLFDKWGEDAHSPSYHSLLDFIAICKSTEDYQDSYLNSLPFADLVEHYLGFYPITEANADEFRVVYWFDN